MFLLVIIVFVFPRHASLMCFRRFRDGSKVALKYLIVSQGIIQCE